jgi:pimeloyl-ACP methyl ester carboxylesterase
VASVLDQMGVHPQAVVGMSLGGLTTIRLAAIRPDLVPRAVIVDVTPGVHTRAIEMTLEERGSTALIGGPKVYDSFEEMADATIALTPNRPASAVRRGVLHNARELDDGKWRWRYDIGTRAEGDDEPRHGRDFVELWDDVSSLAMPVMLVRGGDSKFVLDDHEAEFRARKPDVRVEVVPSAGHAVQSDQPLVLVGLLDDFVPR